MFCLFLFVFGNVCKLMTKSLHRALDRREGWESLVDLDPYARKELEFWKNNVSHLNSSCFADAVRRPSRIVFFQMLALLDVLLLLPLTTTLFRTKTGILCSTWRVGSISAALSDPRASGVSAGSFPKTAAGNPAYVERTPLC